MKRADAPLEFNPAKRDLFSSLGRFDPFTYRSALSSVIPARQAPERRAMHQARDGVGRAEVRAALALAESGLGPMWRTYAARISSGWPAADRARLQGQLEHVLKTAANEVDATKETFNSPRPFQVDHTLDLFGDPPSGSSHPSGHSAISYAAATFLASVAPERRGELLSAAANVGRSRIVLGAHFPGDVAEGARFGAAVGQRLATRRSAD